MSIHGGLDRQHAVYSGLHGLYHHLGYLTTRDVHVFNANILVYAPATRGLL